MLREGDVMCLYCAQASLEAADSVGIDPTITKGIAIAAAIVMSVSALAPMTTNPVKIKAGSVCAKANQKVVTSSNTFVCKKSGKKYIWKVQKKKASVTTAPTGPARPTNTAPSAQPVVLPVEYTLCNKIGEKVIGETRFARCSWMGHANSEQEAIQNRKWRIFEIVKTSTSQSNNYSTTPVENAVCTNSGDTFDVTGGILECRWIAGKKLQWIKINSIKKSFTNSVSPVPIDVCKLKNVDSKVIRTGRDERQEVGFPLRDPDRNGMNVVGTNEVLIVPIDFPDFPGGPGVQEQLANDTKWLLDWYSYYSNGKSKFNVTTINRWLRMPKERGAYPTDGKTTSALTDGNQVMGNQAQVFIDEIGKEVDLRKFSTVYTFHPQGEFVLNDLIVRNHQFKIKEGQKRLNFFSWGRNVEGPENLKWAYYIHETIHDFGIVGHAPGNGWPFGMMANQAGISLALNTWEQFLLGWLPNEQIYCDDAATLKTATISLTPVEREDKQTKMAIIRLSPTRAIVVESHGIDKWSSFKTADREFSPGFYSIMAYVVDLDKSVAPPVKSDGDSLRNEDWAWAVWQKVDGGPSHGFPATLGWWPGWNMSDRVAVLGDTFTIEGIRIKFVATGDFETIEISKVNR
jgi:hypothetical protein